MYMYSSADKQNYREKRAADLVRLYIVKANGVIRSHMELFMNSYKIKTASA